MKILLSLAFVFTALLPLYGQQTSRPARQTTQRTPKPQYRVPEKLTRNQQAHINILRQISNLIRQGKFDQQKFFQAYYAPIADSCVKMAEINNNAAERLNQRINNALQENKRELAARLSIVAKLYQDMGQLNIEIAETYKTGRVGEINKKLKEYLNKENELLRIGEKPCPREWFTEQEAEFIIATMTRRAKANGNR